MKKSRTILHSDLNSFYASVEIMLNPSLRGKDVAVCGSSEERHGIVLSKSDSAKEAGVKTGMVNWEARRKCPDLIIVHPKFEQYKKYSKLTRAIYQRFSDRVEPFGLDECWIDITGYGDGAVTAEKIRSAVKEELGLTVSIGVSFNKVFAKLGSDMKKPDAITYIGFDDFREKVWHLPAGDMIYVGRSTVKKLERYNIRTIGDIANTSHEFLRKLLGVNGEMIWAHAKGMDNSRVMHMDYMRPVKSIGRGITCTSDLQTEEEAWRVMLHLSQDVGHKLRENGLWAGSVQLTVKNNELMYMQSQANVDVPVQRPMDIACKARELFRGYDWKLPVRAITVRAAKLLPDSVPRQAFLFEDPKKREQLQCLENAIEDIRGRFGKNAIYPACLMGEIKTPTGRFTEDTFPGSMYV